MTRLTGRRPLLRACWALAALAAAWPAGAHDFRVGDLVLDHPYATPTPPGAVNGAAYFRAIRNRGDQADRLLGASSPAAARVELHQTVMDGEVMRMRELPSIELPPHAEVPMRHGGGYHLMLVDLKQPLKDGDRIELTLRFERAGSRTVQVWVQTPRDMDAHRH
ncbi:MAG: copper chaperone PCu(A)C [Ottowia sp.]|nr:copper chaperone PCu(A)C [Rhodoferax sp.]MCB2024339.1 copper chaperone PCu(A)C [Ottowia sp.]MCB2036827.1 copper chaperone PCu(A)C [Ottowia sp.]MCB2069597.1 copper chaperone PCu(A)C [Ottowia sp.]